MHQSEVEVAATNEKAKVAHSRRDLRAKVKCAKAVMKAKYEYRMAVQEARVERCTELEESEATYSKALSKKCGHPVSLVCHTPLRTCKTLVGIGRMCFKGGEQKLPGLPVSASSSPTPSPAITQGRCPFFLLPATGTIVIIPSIHYTHPSTSGRRATTLHYFSQTRTQTVSSPKEATFINRCTGRHVNGRGFPCYLIKLQEREDS